MPILPKNLLKDIEKGVSKAAIKEAQALIIKQQNDYEPKVKAALKLADTALTQIPVATLKDISANIEKISPAPAVEANIKPNPKASDWLNTAIIKNQAKVDKNMEQHPLVVETSPSAARK